MLDNLHVPPERFLDPLDEATLVVRAVSPDVFESWKAPSERSQEMFSSLLILDIGLMDQHLQDQTHGINEQMSLAPFDFLAAVITANPPFWLVFAD
jgi:hypothetical protein